MLEPRRGLRRRPVAAEVEADLTVVGRFGGHHGRRSIADDVLDQTVGPVLIVRLKDYGAKDAVAQCPDCVEVGGLMW